MPKDDNVSRRPSALTRWLLRVSKSIGSWYAQNSKTIWSVVGGGILLALGVGLFGGYLLLPNNASLKDLKLGNLLGGLLGTPLPSWMLDSSIAIILVLIGAVIHIGSFGQDYLDILEKTKPLPAPIPTPLPPSPSPGQHNEGDARAQYLSEMKDVLIPSLLFKKLPPSLEKALLLEGQSKPSLTDIFVLPEFIQYPFKVGTVSSGLAHDSGAGPDGWLQMQRYEEAYKDAVEKTPRLSLSNIWQRMTKDAPMMIIQGFPHEGKSTLLARIALHMLLRSSGFIDELPTLNPVLTPFYLSLHDYAQSRETQQNLSLYDYFIESLRTQYGSELITWVEHCLLNGNGLFLLDNFDEVRSERQGNVLDQLLRFKERVRSQEQSEGAYNRFIFVTRIYPLNATDQQIQSASYYVLCEWTLQQSEKFVSQCYTLYPSRARGGPAVVTLRRLNEKLRGQCDLPEEAQDILMLARNPFLLTILVALYIRGGDRQFQGLDLYRQLLQHLLENEEAGNRDVDQIIKRFGPFTQRLQTISKLHHPCVSRGYVLTHIRQSFMLEGRSSEEAERCAQEFIDKCYKGCLFSPLLGEYVGFCHPVFQTYIAALYLKSSVSALLDPQQHDELIREIKVSQRRDTLQLAFALACRDNNEHVADAFEQLLPPLNGTYTADDWLILHFVAGCLVEAQLSYHPRLVERVALQMLYAYSVAQQESRAKMCEEIEDILLRWLRNVPERENYTNIPVLVLNIPVLVLLRGSIIGEFGSFYQRMTLLLLVMIARQMLSFSPLIFDYLIPPLLALAGLPGVGSYQPLAMGDLRGPTNLIIVDLAVTVLSFMGTRGPAGELSLSMTKEPSTALSSFLLKQSLESSQISGAGRRIGILFTPIVVPQHEASYTAYEECVKGWIDVCINSGVASLGFSDRARGQEIYARLRTEAKEIRYPSSIAEIMDDKEAQQQTTWESTWQKFLLNRLEHGPIALYQEVIWLYEMILPTEEAQGELEKRILAHYNDELHARRDAAQHFIALLGAYAWSTYYCRYIRDILDVADLRDITESSDNNTDYIKQIRVLRRPRAMRDIRRIRLGQRNSQMDKLELLDTSNQDWLNYHLPPSQLRQRLLTQDVTKIAYERLLAQAQKAQQHLPFELVECLDLLAIMRGRLLYGIHQALLDEGRHQSEVKDIVDVFLEIACMFDNLEIRDLLLEIIRCLPVNEGKYILHITRIADVACQDSGWHEKIVNTCAARLKSNDAKILPREKQEAEQLEAYLKKNGVAPDVVNALGGIVKCYKEQRF